MKRFTVAALAVSCVSSAFAQDFFEGFDDITTLAGAGWSMQNLSSPVGTTGWFQGNSTVFPAFSGAETSYIGANFNNTTGANTISNWAIMPERTWQNGDVVSFYTRTVAGSTFPDRLQLRLSTNGASTNAGSGPNDVGDFTTLLVDVNDTLVTGGYPETWTQSSATVTGLSGATQGRAAFRYFVADGGPSGANSNYIGIDDAAVEAVPEPATMAVLGLGVLPLLRRRKKAA